jgi:hypothetical protein
MKPLEMLNAEVVSDLEDTKVDGDESSAEAVAEVEAATGSLSIDDQTKKLEEAEGDLTGIEVNDEKQDEAEDSHEQNFDKNADIGNIEDVDENNEVDQQPENSKYAGFHQMWSCDGCQNSRDERSHPYQELHFFRVCADECFCEECIILL